jgi:hypothetical protein
MNPKEVTARDIPDAQTFLREVAEPCLPVVLRGLVRDWPVVRAAEHSPTHFRDYVLQFDAGGQTEVFVGEPRIAGKYYYGDDLKGFNFDRRPMTLADALNSIIETAGDANQP